MAGPSAPKVKAPQSPGAESGMGGLSSINEKMAGLALETISNPTKIITNNPKVLLIKAAISMISKATKALAGHVKSATDTAMKPLVKTKAEVDKIRLKTFLLKRHVAGLIGVPMGMVKRVASPITKPVGLALKVGGKGLKAGRTVYRFGANVAGGFNSMSNVHSAIAKGDLKEAKDHLHTASEKFGIKAVGRNTASAIGNKYNRLKERIPIPKNRILRAIQTANGITGKGMGSVYKVVKGGQTVIGKAQAGLGIANAMSSVSQSMAKGNLGEAVDHVKKAHAHAKSLTSFEARKTLDNIAKTEGDFEVHLKEDPLKPGKTAFSVTRDGKVVNHPSEAMVAAIKKYTSQGAGLVGREGWGQTMTCTSKGIVIAPTGHDELLDSAAKTGPSEVKVAEDGTWKMFKGGEEVTPTPEGSKAVSDYLKYLDNQSQNLIRSLRITPDSITSSRAMAAPIDPLEKAIKTIDALQIVDRLTAPMPKSYGVLLDSAAKTGPSAVKVAEDGTWKMFKGGEEVTPTPEASKAVNDYLKYLDNRNPGNPTRSLMITPDSIQTSLMTWDQTEKWTYTETVTINVAKDGTWRMLQGGNDGPEITPTPDDVRSINNFLEYENECNPGKPICFITFAPGRHIKVYSNEPLKATKDTAT